MNPQLRFRFGIGVLLFAMVVVAGYFWGVNRGDRVRYNTTLSSVVYDARGLLTGEQPIDVQLNEIANLIKKSIDPDSWLERGGMATLAVYPSNQSIVANQYGTSHGKIADLFDSLEQVAKEKRYAVDYDLSEILIVGKKKPSYEQLNELCDITLQAMIDSGTQNFQVSPDASTNSMTVVAIKDVHNSIATYLDRLRDARRVFARIDG